MLPPREQESAPRRTSLLLRTTRRSLGERERGARYRIEAQGAVLTPLPA
jgi:hypothetical protein